MSKTVQIGLRPTSRDKVGNFLKTTKIQSIGMAAFVAVLLYSMNAIAAPAEGIQRVATGGDHTCAVTSAGALHCWGDNSSGQLGIGTEGGDIYATPVESIAAGVTAVAAGGANTCAIVTGALYCWGNNSNGQVGNGDTGTTVLRPTQIIPAGVTAVSTSGSRTCAVVAGAVKCWGFNSGSILGNGDMTFQVPLPALIIPVGATDVQVGISHACAIVSASLRCWGANSLGQVGTGSTGSTVLLPVEVIANGVTAVALGEIHTCAVVSTALHCFGNNSNDQFGLGIASSGSPSPVMLIPTDVTAVIAARVHTCAMVRGDMQCWGGNQFGQIGDGTLGGISYGPKIVHGPATSIATTSNHTCAVSTGSGLVRCWGSNERGQLGPERVGNQTSQPSVTIRSAATTVSTGDGFACAVVNGHVECWGSNSNGQLGMLTAGNYSVLPPSPTTGPGMAGTPGSLAVGRIHVCAIRGLGELLCWGDNAVGELGIGTLDDRKTSPTQVIASGVNSVELGEHHSCAVVNGGLHCWGWNYAGQVGNNGGINVFRSPVEIFASGVTAVAAGTSHTCAIVAGAVYCWGSNARGQIGNGTTTDAATPVQVIGSGASYVAAGGETTCAIVSGALQCWGANFAGQIGNGDSGSNVLAPVTIIASGTTTVGLGGTHSCAVVNGALLCWGSNSYGQLGVDRSTALRLLPGPTIASGVSAVSAALNFTCAVVTGAVQCWGFDGGQLGLPFVYLAEGLASLVARGNGVPITSGDSTPSLVDFTDFGAIGVATVFQRSFAITNSGSNTLILNGLNPVSVQGAGFSVFSQPAVSSLAPGESTTFSIAFTPMRIGIEVGAVAIASSARETTYTFAVAGKGVAGPPGAPSVTSIVPGNGMLTIRYDAPVSDGGAAITSYGVTCQPDAHVATVTTGLLVVGGLNNGTSYDCVVAATNANGLGPASSPVSATPATGLALLWLETVSRKTHGAATLYDLPIDKSALLQGNVTVESRSSGAAHIVVFQFNQEVVAPGMATITPGNAIAGAGMTTSVAVTGASRNEVSVTLAGVPDLQRLQIDLSGVNTNLSATVSLGFLVGDVNSSRTVNASDISSVKAKSGQATNTYNYRFDLDTSGNINQFDISKMKARAGLVIP